jgi:DNA-binding NarL/FixJ family response regulator
MMRLFIADDSENIRKCLADYLSDIEGIEIVGEAGADYFFDKCSEYKELEGVLKGLIRDSAPAKQTLQAD